VALRAGDEQQVLDAGLARRSASIPASAGASAMARAARCGTGVMPSSRTRTAAASVRSNGAPGIQVR
jgi:hypothetical protein